MTWPGRPGLPATVMVAGLARGQLTGSVASKAPAEDVYTSVASPATVRLRLVAAEVASPAGTAGPKPAPGALVNVTSECTVASKATMTKVPAAVRDCDS